MHTLELSTEWFQLRISIVKWFASYTSQNTSTVARIQDVANL